MPRFTRLIAPVAVLLVLLLAGCGGSATSTPAATTAPTKAPAAASSAASTTAATGAPSATVGATIAPTAASTAAPAGTTAASSATTGTVATTSGTLTVFAAASLTESFTEIKGVFEKANPGVTVQYNFGGSPTLVTQLTQGAPADVFASADQPNMDNAVKGGVIAGTPQLFAKNKLVIIVPKENKAGITTPKDLAKPGVKFDTAQMSVPVGAYTQTALDNFSKLPDYGPDFKAAVNKDTVSQEDNVKAIVQKVQLGEVDAGIVYTTDAQAAKDKLTIIAIPDAQNVIATYPIALVKNAKQAALGQKFVAYLLSADGQAILQKYGFAPGT
ncbi:MAG: molybdate ABC transporter substrate-binding protein [Thermomicrobiales bacterium]